jgi:dipeptidyl aminopeptidase/acylaminoacyl peptidase
MRIPTVATLLLFAAPPTLRGQAVPYEPLDTDIPRPVPVEIGLAGADRPDISRFLNVQRAAAPSLSPDGSRLAFRTSISGTPQLWVVDAAGGWPRQLTFGESVTFHQWSPRDDWIVYGTDRGGNEREGFYLIAPDGTRERELLAPADAFREFGGFSPNGKQIAYATTGRTGVDFDIHVLDVDTGADRRVFRGWMGLYAVSWRPDGGAIILSESRGEDANDVYLLDLARGTLDTLFKPDDAAAYGSFAWTPDARTIYLATNQDRDVAGLARYEVANRRLTWVDTPGRDVEDVALSRDGRFLLWTTNDGGYSAIHARDLEGGEPPLPDLPVGIYGVTWAWRAPVAAFYVEGPQVPGDVWTWNAASGQTRRATESATAGLDMSAMVTPEHHSFPATDGETLHGLFYAPPKAANGMGAVLLAVHGGPTAQARPDFDAATQYLLTRGIAVFDLNYRGSTGYGKRFTRLDNQRLRAAQIQDLADALDWLGRAGLADPSRAAVMGGSYGGYLTLAALTGLPDRFAGGVSFVGVSNWITALEGASPQLKASDRIEYGDIDDPADRAFFHEISPITHVDNVRAPLMVVHGANDPRDPVTESDQFVQAVRDRGGDVEYLRFPDEGHGIRKLENRITAYRRIAGFLERVLGPGGTP